MPLRATLSLTLATVTGMIGYGAPALALDTSGYFRAGQGSDLDGAGQACFKLAGAGSKYRLGNECEVYGEVLFSQNLRADPGTRLSAHVMASLASPGGLDNLGGGDNDYRLPQAYLALSDLPGLSGGMAWIGNRYYKREDVHINDYFYWNPSGIGLGIEDYGLGVGKLSYAIFRKDHIDQTHAAARHDLQLRGLPANPGGDWRLGLSYISESGAGRHSGWSMSAQHLQQGVFAGWNKLAFQWGNGPGTGLGSTGNLANTSDNQRLRAVEQLYFKASLALDGLVTVIYQHDAAPAGDQEWFSLGGRLVYSLGGNWKLQAELGHDRVKPEGAAARQLTKFTLAPTWSSASGLFGRPEVRVFYTYANWNEAARQAAGPGDALSASGVYLGDRHGSTLGVQIEHWW
jgi:maltoporin